MKILNKLALAGALVISSLTVAKADRVTYGSLVNGVVASTQNYVLDLGASNDPGSNIDALSVQTIYSSASITSPTFTDGSKSTGTITVVSTQPLVGVQATNTITVCNTAFLTSLSATNYITISSFTEISSPTVSGSTTSYLGWYPTQIGFYNGVYFSTITCGVDFQLATTATGTAVNIATAMNTAFPLQMAQASFGSTNYPVITSTITAASTIGNTYKLTLSSSVAPNALTEGSTPYYTGGQTAAMTNAYFTLNGYVMNMNDIGVASTSSGTAVNIQNQINTYGPTMSIVSAATTSASVVTITALSSGSYANAYTMTTSTSALSLKGATFTGGVNNAFLIINGITLTAGTTNNATTFIPQLSSSNTAQNISNAIQANTTLAAIIASTWTNAGVVTTTSTAIGANTNYGWSSSTQAALGVLNKGMYGGANSAISTTTSIIAITNHGMGAGLPVWISSSAGTIPAPLSPGGTYYAISVDANDIKLAYTSTGAVAGVSIPITTLTGSGSFKLNVIPINGTFTGNLQGSDDGVNFSNLFIGANQCTFSFASPYTPSFNQWDLGNVYFRYLRMNVNTGNYGGININAVINGRRRS